MDLGAQDGAEGGRVGCAAQGIDTSHQANTLVVSVDQSYPKARVSMEGEAVTAELGLGDVDSFSALMTVTPQGLVVSAELNRDTEVLGLENTLDISNWVKHRIPGFSKLVGLPVGRHEKMCIKLLQRLERVIEAANLLHKKDAAHRKAVSKDKGKRELRNLISSINYDGR